MEIRSFNDPVAEAVHGDACPRRFPVDLFRTARRKLVAVDVAAVLDDLRAPPGNRLEALEGDRAGQHSIRINDRWRLCFTWGPAGPEGVEIVDYH